MLQSDATTLELFAWLAGHPRLTYSRAHDCPLDLVEAPPGKRRGRGVAPRAGARS